MSATRKKSAPVTQSDIPDVHLKPGLDNLLATLQAIVDGKLPVSAVGLKINVLREWAHRNKQKDGEIFGLVVKSKNHAS